MHDKSLCDRVVAVRTFTLDGSKMDRADCLAAWGSGRCGHSRPPQDGAVPCPDPNLGYGDGDVVESELDENPVNSATYAASERLRDDPVFLKRLLSAPATDNLVRTAKLVPHTRSSFWTDGGRRPRRRRPLREGVTERDVRLCRSTACAPSVAMLLEPFHHHTARQVLRSAAARRFVAFHQRSLRLVRTLPGSGCRLQPIDSREQYAWRRYPFPHAADFPAALQAIGYPADFASTLVPRPPLVSYWEFVSRLAFQTANPDREEFVRRVIAMR